MIGAGRHTVVHIVILAMGLLGPQTLAFSPDATDQFPRLEGWTVFCDTTEYAPETLWKYINGAADLFVSYQFENLRIAYYQNVSGVEIRAELYRHSSDANAYGMYSQERSPENAVVPFGAEGCADEGMLNFVAGPFYVKLSSNQTGGEVESALGNVAAAIDRTLGQPRRLPAGFDLLPVAGRVPRSEQFIAEAYLGYEFLGGVYSASYGTPDGCRVFALPCESPEDARATLASFLGVPLLKIRNDAGDVISVEDPHHGPIDLLVKGTALMGIVGCPEIEPSRLLLRKGLQ